MTAPDAEAGRPPAGGRLGRRRGVRRLAACVLIAASTALAAAPAAGAATAHTSTSAASRAVLADPAPSPNPGSNEPGIGLGPGAPTTAPTAPSPITTTDPGTGSGGDPSWWDIPGQIQKAIDDWFGSLVADALTPMLNLLGSTLLGTPDVTAMPRVQALWTQMALLANAFYILLVLAGAVIVMTHGTVQSRNSAKEIVPRLLVGMIVGNASIALLALMIHLSDALAGAILGGTINPATAGQALGHMLGSPSGGIFLILLDLGAQVMLIAILLTYIVRVALTVVLAVAAPLALSLHALPQTESVPRLWWRAITGCFLIQLGQSLVFVVGLDVMLDPTTSVSLFGLPNNSALVDTLVFLALCWILIKIPSWVSRSVFGARSSKLMRLAKAVIAYKTLGALGLKRGPGGIPVRTATPPNRPRPNAGGPGWGGPGPGGRGPRGGGSGPVIYTVTQVHPNPPGRAGIGGARLALPPGGAAPAGQGPRRASAPGQTGNAAAPPAPGADASGARGPKHRQMTLPIKAVRAPRPAPPIARPAAGRDGAPGSPDARSRPRHVQPGLFPAPPRPKATVAPPPTGPNPATPPAARSIARMSAAPRPAPAPLPAVRARSGTSSGGAGGGARMGTASATPPPRAAPAPPIRRSPSARTAVPAVPKPPPESAASTRRAAGRARRATP